MMNIIKNKASIYALVALICVMVVSYVYFANVTVRTLTVLQKTKTQMQSLSVEVSDMESKRLAMENDISTSRALQSGFVQVNNPTFIIRNTQNATLSLKMN
jgi:hypothetical protein